MNWDYGEDQDDGYSYDDEPFRKYCTVEVCTDRIIVRFFTHNGGYPSVVNQWENEIIKRYLDEIIFERFGVPHGFNPHEVRYEIMEAMKKSEGV